MNAIALSICSKLLTIATQKKEERAIPSDIYKKVSNIADLSIITSTSKVHTSESRIIIPPADLQQALGALESTNHNVLAPSCVFRHCLYASGAVAGDLEALDTAADCARTTVAADRVDTFNGRAVVALSKRGAASARFNGGKGVEAFVTGRSRDRARAKAGGASRGKVSSVPSLGGNDTFAFVV